MLISPSKPSSASCSPKLPVGSLMVIIAGIGLVVNVGIGVMLLRGESRIAQPCARRSLHIGGDGCSGAIAVVIGGFHHRRDRCELDRPGGSRCSWR